MTFLEYSTILFLIFILVLCLIFISKPQNEKSFVPTNWPILGMIPGFLVNVNRLIDYLTELLIYGGGTFMWKAPWFAKMDILFTANPLDVHHVLSKNYNNYPKGNNFRNIFDILGDGIFNSEGKLWEMHHKVTMSLLKNVKFQSLLESVIWNEMESRLLPVLESISKQGIETDLQDIFQRFTFNNMCKLLLDYDPNSMFLDFPNIQCEKAFLDFEEAVMHRHYFHPNIWKLQQFLRWGHEKKLSDAWKYIDDFIYKNFAQKQIEYNKKNSEQQENEFLILTTLIGEMKDKCGDFGAPTKLLRDTVFSLMFAGKDTISSGLSWFFYILAKHPTAESKILEEIHTHLDVKVGERWNTKGLSEMVYLHGAINESLRLFPPVPFNHKSPLKPDILPSGHKVDQNTMIILSFYSMGRMKSIWGEDCMEFKPERWISKQGRIKHEPSYKFTTFNAGPRTCLGKDMSLFQLKLVSAMIIYNYHIELVEGQSVLPKNSIILQMKHGLKVRLTKRSEVN